MYIDSSRAKMAALQAASYAFENSDVLDAATKDLIAQAIASAVEAAFGELREMQIDETRRRF